MPSSKKRAETLHIPEARFDESDGTTQLVQPVLPGTEQRMRPGRVAYDPEKHHMKLLCPYCDVRVDFNKGSGAACGTQLDGQRPHFKTARGQEHAADCKLPTIQHETDSQIDKNAPYRVHLNMLLGGRTDHLRPVYERIKGGKVVANDERLRPQEIEVDGHTVKVYKEAVSIKHVRALYDLMRRGEGERLRHSLVVHNTVTPWTDFAILNKKRLEGLMDRLLKGASHPVMLYIGLDRAAHRQMAEGRKAFYKRDTDGAKFIIPRLYMDGADTHDVFPAAGDYLVVGMPRVHFNEKSGAYMLNISVKNPAQVMAFSPQELLLEAQAKAAKRRMEAGAAPAP